MEVTTAVGVKSGGKLAPNKQTRGLAEAVAEGSYKLRMHIPQTVEDSVETANERTMLRTAHGEAVGRGPWVAAGGVQTTKTRDAMEPLGEEALGAEDDYAGDLWRW